MSEFSKPLAIIGILAPLGAGAMGIGDIRSHSALNQTLDAEIPLVLSGADKLDMLKIRLASPEAFDKAGVERLYALTQLRFRPVAKPDGRFVIQVSSKEVIQEPFLDFLVEVESPQGKLLREFTLLLDPPRGLTQAATGQIGTPDVPPPRYDAEVDDPALYRRSPPPPRETRRYSPPYAQYEPPSRPVYPPAITREHLTDRSYGPVRRRETLLEIAERIERPASITAGQMATALYLANPRAFSGNIHGLRAGSMLRIPTEDFIVSVGPGGEDESASPGRRARGRPQPAYDYPTDWTAGHTAAAGPGSSEGAVSEVSSRVPSALKKENEELRERLTQLEQQLEEAQRMLVLKTAELSSLQSHQAQPAEAEESTPPAEPALPPASNESLRGPTPAETSAPAPVASVPAVQSASPPNVTAPLPRPTIAVKPTESPPEESPVAPGYWLASGGLLALGLGAWLFRRRRDPPDGADADRIFRKGKAPVLTDASVQASPAAYTESSHAPSAPDLDTSTLDPQWEANVYLRYGHYAQAESLIRAAISQAPEQLDLKLKLFEILQHADNPDAFRNYALEVWGGTKNLPATFWSTVRAMRPAWLPPEIMSEGGAVSAAHSAVAPSSAPAQPVQAEIETETLDIEDTDFTAELRALEAQYAEPERPHPDEDNASTVSRGAAVPAPELDGLAVDATDGPVFTPSALASPAARDSVTATLSGPAGILPTGLLDESDTDFGEELRALEAQYEQHAAETDSAAESVLRFPAQADAGGENRETRLDNGKLLEFVPPASPGIDPSGSQASHPNPPELTPDNLIPFDIAGYPLPLGAVSPSPDADVAGEPVRAGAQAATDSNGVPAGMSAGSPVSSGGDTPFGVLDFDLDLFDPGPSAAPRDKVSDPSVSSANENPVLAIQTLLARARAFADQGDKAAAREALQTVLRDGDSVQQAAAEMLLNELGKVRLSLVPITSRSGQADAGVPMLLPKVESGV